MGCIYLITNLINNKKYIGQTKYDTSHRIKGHLYDVRTNRKNYHLYNAINKYGWENFQVETLEKNIPEEDLDTLEIYYIGLYDTYNNGYNKTLGGGGIRGYHHTPETKQKISKNHNPNMYTKERAEKISFANKGKPKSEEHKRKLSEWAKQRTGENNPFYGKHHSKETLEKNKESHRKYIYYQVDLNTGNIINEFSNIDLIYEYIINNQLSKGKKTSICYRIYATIEGRQKEAYGYGWIGKSVTTISQESKVEDELPLEVHSNLKD